jgi:hypothetical protein
MNEVAASLYKLGVYICISVGHYKTFSLKKDKEGTVSTYTCKNHNT